MKTYNFKYGHGSVSLSLNEADILAELHGTETPPISDIRSALFASLEQPIDSAPLRQRVRPGDRVALVISDMTRFWMRQDLVIPHLVDYLIDLSLIHIWALRPMRHLCGSTALPQKRIWWSA